MFITAKREEVTVLLSHTDVFLCSQRMLASWLEQRAKNMELSEKVRNKRLDSARRNFCSLWFSLENNLFEWLSRWNCFISGGLASKCFATCKCPVVCIKVRFRECFRKRSCHSRSVLRPGILFFEERYVYCFLYHVNYWYQSVTWHEYLITSFILWFSGWIPDQHMKEAEFALYWVGLTRHLCLSPGSVKSSNDVDSPKMKSCTFYILSNFWKSDFFQCWVDIVFVGLWSSCNSKSTIKG